MTLYELTDQMLQLQQMIDDGADPDVIRDTMEGLDYEIEAKADGYAKIMKNLQAEVVALASEIERLSSRKSYLESRIQSLKENLQMSMETIGKLKFRTQLFSFSIQKNPAAVVMDEPYIENIPAEYLIQQEPKIDWKKLREDLLAGKDLEGIAHLSQGQSLRIR